MKGIKMSIAITFGFPCENIFKCEKILINKMWDLVVIYRLPYSQLNLILTGSKHGRCVKYSPLQRSLSYEHIKNLIF